MGNLKLLDLFSGVGGFTIAADRVGIETVAFCEIDKFPQSVLKHHYPKTPIINDVCELTKESFKSATGLDSVDIVCGGSPCTSFSVAGLRQGLKGASGIFYEYARIIKELKPKYVVWENVPGALSSSEGRDFEQVLCAFTGHDGIEFTKWGTCGYFEGKSGFYNVAYRIFDSRYFGVPQRRRRIFLVGSLGNDDCLKILFEQESVRRDIAQSKKSRKDTPAFVESSFGGFRESKLGQTLTTSGGSIGNGGETIVLNESQSLFENHAQDSRYEQKEISPTITSRAGTGGNNLPIIVKQHNHGEVSSSEISPTLNSQSGAGRIPMTITFTQNDAARDASENLATTLRSGGNGGTPNQAVCVIDMRHATRTSTEDKVTGSGICKEGDPSPTISCGQVHAVAIRENIINRQDHNGGNGVGAIEENCYTLNATGVHAVATRSVVRRLTPLECERLQGFPDHWTDVPNAKDTARYKALGNAITVNVAEWIFKRLVAIQQN